MEAILKNIKLVILAVTVIGVIVLSVKYHQKIKKFILEVKSELTKVSWSSRQELIGSTAVVIVVTFVLAIYIGLIDLFLSKVLSVIYR